MPGATLCKRCRVLQFDDEDLGLYTSTDNKGNPVLDIPEGDSRLQDDAYGRKFARLHLEFYLKDTLPDLLELQKSSTEGCEFCAILRRAIQKIFGINSNSEIEVSLHLFWSKGAGIDAVVASVASVGNAEDLTFLLGSSPGIHRGCG
jgi:hypothetical protein